MTDRDATDPTPRRPATPAEVRRRVSSVRGWINWEGVGVEEALERIADEFGVGRRQALRYWVRAYLPILSDEDRRARARGVRPRSDTGFARWPSVEGRARFGAAVRSARESPTPQ